MARLNSMLIGVEILLYGIAWETVFISFVYYASLSHIRIGKKGFPGRNRPEGCSRPTRTGRRPRR